MNVETVSCDVTVRCALTATVCPQCPIVDEADAYDVTVAWQPGGHTFEKWSLHAYLQSFDGAEITQEELANRIYESLRRESIADLRVTVRDTKHMDMVVVAG